MADSAIFFVDLQELAVVFGLSDEVISVVLILEGNEGLSCEVGKSESC